MATELTEPVRRPLAAVAPPPEHWSAVHLGAEAARIAGASGFHGFVLAATSRAIYVGSGDGEIFGLGGNCAVAHTRLIVVRPNDSRGLPPTEPGARVILRGSELVLGGWAFVDLGAATPTSGRLVSPTGCAPSAVAAHSVSTALAAAAGMHRGENLGLLLHSMANSGDLPKSAGTPDVTLNSAIEHARHAAFQCRSGSLVETVSGLDWLAGLGPGLTPSGDDFAGGLLFSASHLARVYGPASPWGLVNPAAALERWAGRTNRISYAYLRDFANGQGPFPMHDLMCLMLGGEEGLEIAAYAGRIEKIASIGHSSGWDMLAGMFVGLLPLLAGMDGQRR